MTTLIRRLKRVVWTTLEEGPFDDDNMMAEWLAKLDPKTPFAEFKTAIYPRPKYLGAREIEKYVRFARTVGLIAPDYRLPAAAKNKLSPTAFQKAKDDKVDPPWNRGIKDWFVTRAEMHIKPSFNVAKANDVRAAIRLVADNLLHEEPPVIPTPDAIRQKVAWAGDEDVKRDFDWCLRLISELKPDEFELERESVVTVRAAA